MRSTCFYLRGAIPANADYALTLSLKVANASTSTTTSSDYELIIPSAFTITNSGWNEITDGITAKVSGDKIFDSGYKLTVTATTDGTLTAEGITDTISYTLKAASTDTSATTAWEFSADELNASKDSVITGTTKTLGVEVEDYSTKADGDYSDTITFAASVEKVTLSDALVDGGTITINFTDGFESGNSATFTYNSGAFSETHSGSFLKAARMSITDGKLVAQLDGFNGSFSRVNTVTLNPDDNTWTIARGNLAWTDNYTISVNGVDITSQLIQQE